jgi:hypothetical protein
MRSLKSKRISLLVVMGATAVVLAALVAIGNFTLCIGKEEAAAIQNCLDQGRFPIRDDAGKVKCGELISNPAASDPPT